MKELKVLDMDTAQIAMDMIMNSDREIVSEEDYIFDPLAILRGTAPMTIADFVSEAEHLRAEEVAKEKAEAEARAMEEKRAELDREIESLLADIADLRGRKYKSNPGRVSVGDPDSHGMAGGTYRIDAINERRRAREISFLSTLLKEARVARKNLG